MKIKPFSKFLGAFSLIALVACVEPRAELPLLDSADFEAELNGAQISLYTLTNSRGTTLQMTNYGGRVVSLWCEDRDGEWADVVLGQESIDQYLNNSAARFLGAAVGRVANRIAEGRFTLEGREYQLSQYSAGHCHHGGEVGFDRVVWSVDSLSDNAIYLSYLSPDMEEGFPGNLDVKMSYTLTDDNEFRIDYRAVSDRATVVNLTNHSFFNLRGEGSGPIDGHIITVAADNFTPVNSQMIPTGEIVSVVGTPFDLREGRSFGEIFEDERSAEDEQFALAKGFDHNFVIDRQSDDQIEFVASLYEPTSGRVLEVWSTQPGMHLFSGNSFNGVVDLKRGNKLRYREGVALETQHFPDSPNHPNFPSIALATGEEYRETCIYKLGIK